MKFSFFTVHALTASSLLFGSPVHSQLRGGGGESRRNHTIATSITRDDDKKSRKLHIVEVRFDLFLNSVSELSMILLYFIVDTNIFLLASSSLSSSYYQCHDVR